MVSFVTTRRSQVSEMDWFGEVGDQLGVKAGPRQRLPVRFLRHVQLWPETLDIVAIQGPPERSESADDEPAPWNQHDEPPAEDWAA
jgi:hypothetical protein